MQVKISGYKGYTSVGKKCAKCGERKPHDAFPEKERRCRVCAATHARKWYSENRGEARESRREYYRHNKSQFRVYGSKWRAINEETIRKYKKKYREANRGRIQEQKREDYLLNGDKIRARIRAYRALHKDRLRECAYARRRRVGKPDPDTTRAILLIRRMPCAYCGGTGGQVDHVVPISRGGAHHFSNMLPACQKCNDSKNAKTPEEWTNRWYQ